MSKSIDVLAKDFIKSRFTYTDEYLLSVLQDCFGAGYKQRSDELIDLLVELEDYFDNKADAEPEGENMEYQPNKEMQFLGKIREYLEL